MKWLTTSAVIAFAIDQLSKLIVVHWWDLKNPPYYIEVFPPFLNFQMGWNTGINFGLLDGYPEQMRYVLVIMAMAVSAGLAWWAPRNLSRTAARLGAGAVIGGALANALDRVIYGAVADFLNMSCCGIDNPFTFNVADIFIFAGVFAIVLFDDKASDKKPT